MPIPKKEQERKEKEIQNNFIRDLLVGYSYDIDDYSAITGIIKFLYEKFGSEFIEGNPDLSEKFRKYRAELEKSGFEPY